MKFRSYAVLIAAVVVASVLAFVLPGQPGQTAAMMAVLFAVMTAFSAFVSWPPGAGFVEQQSRLVVLAGIGIAVLAAGVLVWSFVVAMAAESSSDASEPYIFSSIMIGLTGFLIISAPRISRQSREARERQQALNAAKQKGHTDPVFDGVAEGRQALLAPWKNGILLLRIFWPWLLGCLGAVGMSIALAQNAKKDDFSPLWWLFAAVLIAGVGLPTVAVAWHRWLIEQKKPALITLPDGRAFSYLWRIWVFASVTGRATSWAGDAVTNAVRPINPAMASVAGGIAGDLLFFAACGLASNFALRLPAVAVRDKSYWRSIALIEGRRLGLGLPLGLLISIAPFTLIQIAVEVSSVWTPKDGAGVGSSLFLALAGVDLVLAFAAIGSGTAFLSRAYLATKARLAAPL